VLAWIVGNKPLLDMIWGGMKIYEAFARANMGWTGGPLAEEAPDLYALYKAMVLALGYQAGWEKFILMAWTHARVDITKDDPEWAEETDRFTGEIKTVSGYGQRSKKTVAEFREKNAPVTALWKQLDISFKQSLGSNFVMTLPSGRRMTYCQVRADTRVDKDPKTGQPVKRTVFTADADGRRKPYYGGKLTENLIQATARDVFAFHLLRLEQQGFRVLFSVHDEAIIECDMNRTKEEVRAIMSECPEWLAGCPIGCDPKEVERYCK
jgi:DNA polymerase